MMDFDKLFNCEDLTAFYDSITREFNFRGFSESKFLACEYKNMQFLVKLFYYLNSPYDILLDTKGYMHQNEVEIKILKKLREKIINKNLTPCILEIIYYKTCNSLDKIIPSNEKCTSLNLDVTKHQPISVVEHLLDSFCQYKDKIKMGLAENKITFSVLERCDLTLDSYLRKIVLLPISETMIKSIIFQVVYTIYVIQKIFPGFIHNDLHIDNILIKLDREFKYNAREPVFLSYNIFSNNYYIPYYGFVPKIIDFGFSKMPTEGIESNIYLNKHFMNNRVQNDILLLFHWLFVVSHDYNSNEEIVKIINEIDTEQLYLHIYNADYIKEHIGEFPDIETILKNKIFDEYKIECNETNIYKKFDPL